MEFKPFEIPKDILNAWAKIGQRCKVRKKLERKLNKKNNNLN